MGVKEKPSEWEGFLNGLIYHDDYFTIKLQNNAKTQRKHYCKLL